MNVLEKRLTDLTPQDIQWLVDQKIQEGSDLEFKEALSTKKGAPDRWMLTCDAVGEEAKSDLVKELVGFANSQGGVLVLGIRDSKTKPAKADAICSVPKVADLADRLKMACRDLIEPKVLSLEVCGVPMSDDGSGVVVFRVNGGSSIGPHRHRGNKECYIRRNDETVPMDMIEIQRHSVELQERFSRLDDEFVKHRTVFRKTLEDIPEPNFGICIRALPLGTLFLPNIHRLDPVKPVLTRIPVRFPKGATAEALVPGYSHLNWRPILRGSSAQTSDSKERFRFSVTSDARIAFEWACSVDGKPDESKKSGVYMAWLTGSFANVLLGVERIRRAASAPSVEFVLEFAYSAASSLQCRDYNQPSHHTANSLPAGDHVFPRYGVGSAEDFDTLMRVFEADVANFSGADHAGHEPSYDFSAALASIHQSFAAPVI